MIGIRLQDVDLNIDLNTVYAYIACLTCLKVHHNIWDFVLDSLEVFWLNQDVVVTPHKSNLSQGNFCQKNHWTHLCCDIFQAVRWGDRRPMVKKVLLLRTPVVTTVASCQDKSRKICFLHFLQRPPFPKNYNVSCMIEYTLM